MSIPDDYTAQVQQSQYYLIVIRYPGGNRLYVISRRSDGTSCVVDTNDRCIAQVTELPDGFDLDDLPDDVAPTIPAGRPAPSAASPPPGGGYTPPVVPAPPAASAPAAAGNPQPRDGATGVAVETLLLSWSAADRAASYDVYWGTGRNLAADAGLGTPIGTTDTSYTIPLPWLNGLSEFYWRVDAKNDQGTTRGSAWTFHTGALHGPPIGIVDGTLWISDISVVEGTVGTRPGSSTRVSVDVYWRGHTLMPGYETSFNIEYSDVTATGAQGITTGDKSELPRAALTICTGIRRDAFELSDAAFTAGAAATLASPLWMTTSKKRMRRSG